VLRISKKLAQSLFVFFIAISMSFLMSFVLTAINLGFPADFVWALAASLAIAFPIAFAAAFLNHASDISPRRAKFNRSSTHRLAPDAKCGLFHQWIICPGNIRQYLRKSTE
jgi:hypothetical protein